MKLRFVEKSFFIHAYIVGNVQTCILNTSIKNKTNSKRSGVVKPDEKNIKLTTNYTIIYKIKKKIYYDTQKHWSTSISK